MTNETTASQPKMKCVEPEDWPAHYDKNDPTKGTNMDSVVFGTSQPKSIGDDAQFQKRLTEYDAAIYPGQKALRLVSLIALIDSRAPAAQASATIQAAPAGWEPVYMTWNDTIMAWVDVGLAEYEAAEPDERRTTYQPAEVN